MFDIVVVCIKGPFRKHNKHSQTQCHRFILTPHLEPTAAVKKKKKRRGGVHGMFTLGYTEGSKLVLLAV